MRISFGNTYLLVDETENETPAYFLFEEVQELIAQLPDKLKQWRKWLLEQAEQSKKKAEERYKKAVERFGTVEDNTRD